MRRYCQGTLDFDCALYAVINALSWTCDLSLANARAIYQDTLLQVSRHPGLWEAFVRNRTDYAWLVEDLLATWCAGPPYAFAIRRPFASLPDASVPREKRLSAAGHGSVFPAERPRAGSPGVWEALETWLVPTERPRAAILRFLRFLPQVEHPVVCHWTTATGVAGNRLELYDASAEPGALHFLEKTALFPAPDTPPLVWVEPASLFLLERIR